MNVLEPQTYYDETSESPTEGVVPINDTQTVEKRDGTWHGPFDADMNGLAEFAEEGVLSRVGKLTDEQFEQVIGIARKA